MPVGFVDRSAKKSPLPEPPAPSVADIMVKVEEAKARAAACQREQYALVEKSVFDQAADDRYQALARETVDLQRDIEKYQLAISKMQHEERAQKISESAEQRRAREREFEAHAAKSVEAVAEIAAGLEQATKAYADFLKACGQMAASLPAGVELPEKACQQFDYLTPNGAVPTMPPAALAAEMFRLGNVPVLRLPGAKPPTSQVAGLPAAVESMTVARERVTAWLTGLVRTELERMEDKEEKALAQ